MVRRLIFPPCVFPYKHLIIHIAKSLRFASTFLNLLHLVSSFLSSSSSILPLEWTKFIAYAVYVFHFI